ncbi:MAG TPA: DMT family transporter [Devosiaceae bacterium]|nr:DMT family transporter [Devosiaceae bacterium]
MPRPLATLMLLVTTMLWGLAFVAQKSAMQSMGPLTFSAVRYALGSLVVLPLVVWEYRRRKAAISRHKWRLIGLLSLFFFGGVYLQQVGLTMTTVTNSGFLTSLYVLLVPVIALAVARHAPHPIVWLCMPMAIVGIFLLNGGRLDRFNLGDLLVVGSAFCWAVQVYLIGHLARSTGLPITISVICFAVTALLSALGSVMFEAPHLGGIGGGWVEILYAGILSTAVAFTMQAIGQQYVPPANAAIILSAESLFAALGGAVLLSERLPGIGYAGAALIFLAIVLVETVPILLQRRADRAELTAVNPN